MLIDLHVHSNESDGSFTPEQMVDYAVAHGVGALALCDHDTTAGLQRFLTYGAAHAVQCVPGVEISAEWASGNCHILGLGVSDSYEPLEKVLKKIRGGRNNRNDLIIEKLNALGFAVTLEQTQQFAGGDVLGRPHMAQLLVAKGYVGSVQEAFDRYLAKGKPAYADRYRLSPADSVKLLTDAGAIAVLAHPSQLQLSECDLERLVEKLIQVGLSGIEVYTPYTSEQQIREYIRIARMHDLIITGGSDFHGDSKPENAIGHYQIGQAIPEECFHQVTRQMQATVQQV